MAKMSAVETANLEMVWECSACRFLHKATRKLESSRACPTCGAEIEQWVYEEKKEKAGD